MRSMRAAAAVALLALAAGCGAGDDNAAETADPESSALPIVFAQPDAKFARTIAITSDLAESTRRIDACDGPVAIDLGSSNPVVIAQHDYCGGSSWISRLEVGDAVQLEGEGFEPGLYVARELKYGTRLKATVGDLPQTALVLQTCVTKTKLVLVGLEKFSPFAVA